MFSNSLTLSAVLDEFSDGNEEIHTLRKGLETENGILDKQLTLGEILEVRQLLYFYLSHTVFSPQVLRQSIINALAHSEDVSELQVLPSDILHEWFERIPVNEDIGFYLFFRVHCNMETLQQVFLRETLNDSSFLRVALRSSGLWQVLFKKGWFDHFGKVIPQVDISMSHVEISPDCYGIRVRYCLTH